MDEKLKRTHSLKLENRSGLKLTGVTDVDSFNEESVIAYTDYGSLTVSGENLNVKELNLSNGTLEIEGEVTAMIYSSKTSKEKGI
jgi:sporulation protein YabP